MANELEKIKENQLTLSKNQVAINESQATLGKNQVALNKNMAEGMEKVEAAVNKQTFAIVASQALLARTFNQGFDQINSTLDMKFARVENVLDRMSDIMNSPLLTQFRELYDRAAERYRKKQYEEALEDTQAALDKNKTNYAAWFLQGIIYASGKSKYSDVVDLDKSIDSLSKAAKYIDPEIEGNADARRMATEIHFSLGNVQLSKSKALSLENKKDESSEMLIKARRSFEESYQYSNDMLESLFNTARCKVIQGETVSVIRDLETLVLRDRNYCIKVYADNDFSSIGEQFTSLINKLKNKVFISAKNDYDRINAMMAELKSLGGTTNVTVPATFIEALPYFDVLDYAEDFKRIIPIVEKTITNKKAEIARAEQEERERQNLYDSLIRRMSNASTEKEYYDLSEQFRKMNSYKNTAKLAGECDDKYREYKNRREQLEKARREAERRKIVFGKTLAMIIQIGAIIAFFSKYGYFSRLGASYGLVFFLATAVFFCRIFFTELGKGLVSMVLIIVLSVIWFFVGVSEVYMFDKGFYDGHLDLSLIFCHIGYVTGSIAAAILAFICKD